MSKRADSSTREGLVRYSLDSQLEVNGELMFTLSVEKRESPCGLADAYVARVKYTCGSMIYCCACSLKEEH